MTSDLPVRTCRPVLVGLGVLCCAVLWGAVASANPLDAFGMGSRSIAMGGASAATVEDFSANYYNPGALAFGEQLQIEFGYVSMVPTLTVNDGDLNVDSSRGVQGGIVMPGELFGHNVGVSLGLHLPDERVARLRSLPQRQPRFVMFDNRPQRLAISASGAAEVIEGLYLGAGLTFLANTQGTLQLAGDLDLFNVETAELFSGLDVDLAAVRYLTAGALVVLGDLRIGLTFRDEFKLRLDLGVDVLGDLYSGDILVAEDVRLVVTTHNVNLFSPRQVALGVGWSTERLTVEADLTWVQWSAFPAPASLITVEIDERVAGLAKIPPFEQPLAPNFHDLLIPRAGIEFLWLDTRHVDLRARAGYFWEPSPAPDQPGLTNYIDSDKHGASLGLSVALADLTEIFPRPVTIDLTGQYIYLEPRTYRKDDPADPIGDYVARGRFIGGSASARFVF